MKGSQVLLDFAGSCHLAAGYARDPLAGDDLVSMHSGRVLAASCIGAPMIVTGLQQNPDLNGARVTVSSALVRGRAPCSSDSFSGQKLVHPAKLTFDSSSDWIP